MLYLILHRDSRSFRPEFSSGLWLVPAAPSLLRSPRFLPGRRERGAKPQLYRNMGLGSGTSNRFSPFHTHSVCLTLRKSLGIFNRMFANATPWEAGVGPAGMGFRNSDPPLRLSWRWGGDPCPRGKLSPRSLVAADDRPDRRTWNGCSEREQQHLGAMPRVGTLALG